MNIDQAFDEVFNDQRDDTLDMQERVLDCLLSLWSESKSPFRDIIADDIAIGLRLLNEWEGVREKYIKSKGKQK